MPLAAVQGVLCAGNISHDILLRPVDQFRWGTSTWVEEFTEDMGGNGSNTSYALALLGTPVRLLGLVGSDARGDALLEKLSGAGVDTGFVGRSRNPTTTTVCVANSQGDRLFLQRVGSSLEAFAESSDFSTALCRGMSHYHQANLYSLPNLRRNSGEQMRRAKTRGLTTSIDTGWAAAGLWMEVLEPALPFCDVLFVNEDEARMLTGETEPDRIARVLRDRGAQEIVLKLGARGCVVFAAMEEFASPGLPVPVIDTTGAGDAFAAGFLASLHRGLSYSEAARMANAVGALSVTALGAGRALRSWDETVKWANALP